MGVIFQLNFEFANEIIVGLYIKINFKQLNLENGTAFVYNSEFSIDLTFFFKCALFSTLVIFKTRFQLQSIEIDQEKVCKEKHLAKIFKLKFNLFVEKVWRVLKRKIQLT